MNEPIKGAAAAVAKAQAEIASRGLVVTVVQNYWGMAAAQLKLEALQKAADEGEGFLKLTQDLEHGGEVERLVRVPLARGAVAHEDEDGHVVTA